MTVNTASIRKAYATIAPGVTDMNRYREFNEWYRHEFGIAERLGQILGNTNGDDDDNAA